VRAQTFANYGASKNFKCRAFQEEKMSTQLIAS